MKRIVALFSIFVTLVFLGAAKQKAVPRAIPDGGKAFAHVKYLASDEFKGRKSGTPEYRRAAEYVAAEMAKAGLKPGGENGTWFQEVPFKNWTDFKQPVRLEVVSPERRAYFAGRGRDFTPVSGTGSGTVKGGLVFAGYGVVSEKDGWDDYAALEAKGKIVLVLPGLPASLGNDAKNEWNFEKKVKTAAAKGAVGLIEMDLTTPGAQAGPQAGPRPRFGVLRPGQCPEGFVVMRAGRDFLSDIFYLVKKSWKDLVSKTLRLKKSMTLDLGAEVEMEAHFFSGERTAPNVVGGMTEFAELYEIVKRGLDEETKTKLRPRLNYRGSDHTSFWGKNVPAINLRTGEVLTGKLDDEHPEYHLPGDRTAMIDPELLRLACQYHADILQNIGSSRENLLDPVHRTLFLHRDAAVVDLHCDTIARFMAGEDLSRDLPKGHIDIPKLKRGAVDLEVFACFAPPPSNDVEKGRSANGVFAQIEAVNKLVEKNPDDLALVRSVDEAGAARNASKTGVLVAIEGGYAIENDLVLLREFYRAGVRLMTLTHWTATDWADASGDEKAVHGGLTELGESVVAEMNRLGMIIDVSHVHDETFWDVLRLSKAPVVASHSCCRALVPHHRNLEDEMLKALAEKGGVVGINFYPGFLSADYERLQSEVFANTAADHGLPADRAAVLRAEPAVRDKFNADFRARWAKVKKSSPPIDVKTVVDHIDHVVKVTGKADCVGLGSDFDGMSDTPAGLENAGLLPNITKELVARGYKPADIRKILGGNFLRVFGAVEKAKEK